jgi:hypothetical protein
MKTIVYGVSKPKNGRDHMVDPSHDIVICECEDIGFAETIAKLMAKQFPGELYYCVDPDMAKVLYSFCVWEEDNGLINYAETLKWNKMYHLREDALVVAQAHDHNMENWIGGQNNSHSYCVECSAAIWIASNPKGGEPNITGTAMTTYCHDERMK